MTSSLPRPPAPPPGPVAAVVNSDRAPVWMGVAIAILGVVGGLGWAALQFILLSRDVADLHRIEGSSPLELVTADQVDWTVFVEPDDASLVGVEITVTDVRTRAEVPLGDYGSGFRYATPSRSGRAVATVSLAPGTYLVESEGAVTVALGPSPAGRLVWLVAGAAALGLPLLVGGTTMAVRTAVRDTRRRARLAAPPPASPWTSGEWPREGPD